MRRTVWVAGPEREGEAIPAEFFKEDVEEAFRRDCEGVESGT